MPTQDYNFEPPLMWEQILFNKAKKAQNQLSVYLWLFSVINWNKDIIYWYKSKMKHKNQLDKYLGWKVKLSLEKEWNTAVSKE